MFRLIGVPSDETIFSCLSWLRVDETTGFRKLLGVAAALESLLFVEIGTTIEGYAGAVALFESGVSMPIYGGLIDFESASGCIKPRAN